MKYLFALTLLLSTTRGLYTTDDHTRDPSRPLPLPPETISRSFGVDHDLTSRQIITAAGDVLALRPPTPSIPIAPTTIPPSPPSPIPIPMDLQLSYALTKPCLSHLTNLLSNPKFTSCLPFSLLLTTSTGFATMLSTAATSGNYTTLNTLMAYVTSPQPSSEECDEFLTEAYWNMGSKNSGCQADLNKRSAAVDARLGLGSAGLMRRAAGLRNPDNGKWCYLEAVASTRPDDLYLWSLPAGISLPPSTKPTCSKCSALLLGQYTSSASTTPSLNGTLINAAVGMINGACGQDFVQYSAIIQTSAAGRSGPSIGYLMMGLMTGAAAVAVFQI